VEVVVGVIAVNAHREVLLMFWSFPNPVGVVVHDVLVDLAGDDGEREDSQVCGIHT
jgi:hypothetical protein